MKPVRLSRTESHLSFRIKMIRADEDGLATASADATAFLWERNDVWYLVTNLHNLTGWNHAEGRALSDMGLTPTHLESSLGTFAEQGDKTHASLFGWKSWRLSLVQNDEPLWMVHPEHGERVDVGVIEVCDVPDEEQCRNLGIAAFATVPANRHEWVDYAHSAGDDAFVLGYPHEMSGGGFPIWKRASIATEPEVDLDGLPKLLLDTATRKGMSGSPVIGARRGVTSPNGEFGDDTIFGDALNFLGIYSGRVGDDPFGLQLGVVWKARVIDEIVTGGRRGVWPWCVGDGRDGAIES